jgi:hypothetical protein
MKHHLYPCSALLQAMVIAAGISTAFGTSAAAKADGALATPPATHCNWGDFGCTNPPPRAGTGAAPSALACDKDLSTPGECWTNCKTEDEITICDIISLDTFWPESPQPGAVTFSGKTVQKTAHGRPVVGRVMAAAR